MTSGIACINRRYPFVFSSPRKSWEEIEVRTNNGRFSHFLKSRRLPLKISKVFKMFTTFSYFSVNENTFEKRDTNTVKFSLCYKTINGNSKNCPNILGLITTKINYKDNNTLNPGFSFSNLKNTIEFISASHKITWLSVLSMFKLHFSFMTRQ